jgi:putative intracellular protease/amidase
MRALLALSFLPLIYAGNALKPITRLDQVPASGDQYPTSLPQVTRSSIQKLQGKQVLFVASHGVEDHEVLYTYQYFHDRGANVTLACPSGPPFLVLSDFIKPSFIAPCLPVNTIDLEYFDAVFIPGGFPSSSAIRLETSFLRKLKKFYLHAGPEKLIAIICSGNEVLIDSGILNYLEDITGSPASAVPLRNALKRLGKDEALYHGLNDPSQDALSEIVSYPSGENRANLVLGRNPDASLKFVQTISQVWLGVDERVVISNALRWPSNPRLFRSIDGLYDLQQLAVLRNLTIVPSKQWDVEVPSLQGKKATIVVGPGAASTDLELIFSLLEFNGVNPTIACPGWVITYKQGLIVSLTSPPILPMFQLKCTQSLNELSQDDDSIVFVPGGLFSTGGVLRNDGDMNGFLSSLGKEGRNRVVFLQGSGQELIASSGLELSQPLVTGELGVNRNLKDVGLDLNNQVDLVSVGQGSYLITANAKSDARQVRKALEILLST